MEIISETCETLPTHPDAPAYDDYYGKAKALRTKLKQAGFNTRSCNALTNTNHVYVGDIVSQNDLELHCHRGLGRKSREHVKQVLALRFNLHIGMRQLKGWSETDDLQEVAQRLKQAR